MLRRKTVEYREVSPLPKACQKCTELDCYNCDIAGLRWIADPLDELRLMKKMKQRAIQRLQREITEIEGKIQALETESKI